jgi:8-oxo-dGTP pyrophosphatase MutT (NUDIX family)
VCPITDRRMSDRERRWRTLSSKTILERWWLTLRVDAVELPTGAVIDEFHVAEYPDWALTIPITASGEVVLVEQYRYGVDRVGLEFPAGVVQPGEDPLAAASRELREETGFEVEGWRTLGRLAVEPARHTNHAHLFVASGASRAAAPDLDDTEDLRVRLVPAGDLPLLIERGEMAHGIHVAAAFWAMQRGWLPAGAPAG